jgi:hypothetical protein
VITLCQKHRRSFGRSAGKILSRRGRHRSRNLSLLLLLHVSRLTYRFHGLWLTVDFQRSFTGRDNGTNEEDTSSTQLITTTINTVAVVIVLHQNEIAGYANLEFLHSLLSI